MRVIRKVQKTVIEEEVVNDYCNKCGESCYDSGSADSMFGTNGMIEQTVMGGYNSNFLGDMNEYVFSMCERCVWGLFQSFKIPAHVHDPGEAVERTMNDELCCSILEGTEPDQAVVTRAVTTPTKHTHLSVVQNDKEEISDE